MAGSRPISVFRGAPRFFEVLLRKRLSRKPQTTTAPVVTGRIMSSLAHTGGLAAGGGIAGAGGGLAG